MRFNTLNAIFCKILHIAWKFYALGNKVIIAGHDLQKLKAGADEMVNNYLIYNTK